MEYYLRNGKESGKDGISVEVDEVPDTEFEILISYEIITEATVMNPPDAAYPGSRSVEAEITGVVVYDFKTEKESAPLQIDIFSDWIQERLRDKVEEYCNDL